MFKNEFEEFLIKNLDSFLRLIFFLNAALLIVVAPFAFFFPKSFEGIYI